MSSGSSSDNSSESSRSSSAEFIPDLVKLKPYDWEPRRSVIELEKVEQGAYENSSDEDDEQARIGNKDWCHCGLCRPESLCCPETNEIPDEIFEGLFLCQQFLNLCYLG